MVHQHTLITRVYSDLSKYFKDRKVLVIFGPRRVGKTTLIKAFLRFLEANKSVEYNRFKPFKYVTVDDITIQQVFSVPNLTNLQEFIANTRLLVIDEAQRIPNIGISIKLLVDNIDDIFVILTGSSSFNLAGQVGEPLTGRKYTLNLYPVSVLELRRDYGDYWVKQNLED